MGRLDQVGERRILRRRLARLFAAEPERLVEELPRYLGALAGSVQDGEADRCNPVVRIESSNQRERAERILTAVGLEIGKPQPDVDQLVIWVDQGGRLEHLDRVADPPLLHVDERQVVA